MSERGIIFVSGATGSGKSTTLACMLEYVNTHDNAMSSLRTPSSLFLRTNSA